MQKLNSQNNNHDSGNRGLNPKTDGKKVLPKTLKERIRWLFTKDGLPTLFVIIIGFGVGFFVDGAVGIILSTVLGLVILSFLKKFHLPTKPWQATLSTLLPIIARLSFMMVFFLPIADYLMLPDGHYPNTLMKYLSIMVVVPKNIVSLAPTNDVFPGIPLIVAFSVFLMFWGSLNLDKRKNIILAFAGLILYTLSPSIASAANGYAQIRIIFSFFAIGYYLAWVGLALVIVNKLLPRILKMPASMPPSSSIQKANRLMSIMPFVGIALFVTQLQNLHPHVSIVVLQDFSAGFEAAHHEVASVLSGAIAGIGAGVIMDNVSSSDSSSSDDSSNSAPPTVDSPLEPTTPPETPPEPISPPETPPQPPTPPGQEPLDPDEIKQAIEQHKIDEQYKSAYEKDHQKSINDDITKAANDDKAFHDMQDHVHDDTKKFWKDFYTNENEFNSWEAEHEIKKAEGFEKLENAAKTTKKGCDWFIWGAKYVAGPVGKKIADVYEATSEFAEGAADGGLKQGLEKGGIKVGEKLLEHVTMHTLEHKLGKSDVGKFVKYVNEEGEPPTEISVESLNNVAVDMTKDKIKGLGPEQAGKWAEKKLGLEESEGGSEGGSEGASAPAE